MESDVHARGDDPIPRVCVPRQLALPNKQDRNGGARQRRAWSLSGGDCGPVDIHVRVNATKRPQSRGERPRALRERSQRYTSIASRMGIHKCRYGRLLASHRYSVAFVGCDHVIEILRGVA